MRELKGEYSEENLSILTEALLDIVETKYKIILQNLLNYGQCLRTTCENDCPIYEYGICKVLTGEISSEGYISRRKAAAYMEYKKRYGEAALFEELL